MDRCRILVEGQTEETFANKILLPHLYSCGFQAVTVTVVETKRLADGTKYRGGVTKWPQLLRDITLLTRDSGSLVTTMFDFYALPQDVPGMTTMMSDWDSRRRAAHVESEISKRVDSLNLLPNLLLHELEALLYSSPQAVGAHFSDPSIVTSMEQDLRECLEPELVDGGSTTAPSKRIRRHRPGYLKTTDGPTILADIGLDGIRAACPKFDQWLATVEGSAP